MTIRFATILFAGLILQVAGPTAAYILFAGVAGTSQWTGAPATHKASNIGDEPPLLDQLLETLNVVGCSRIGRLARAALKPPTESLKSFAAVVGGANSERNLHRWAKKQTWFDFLPEPFDFEIQVADVGGMRGGVFTQEAEPIPMMHSALLPHEVFHTLFHHARDVFEHLLGDTETLRVFWQVAAIADDEWYRLHPVIAGAPGELCILVGLHGDDAGVHGGRC